MRNYDFRNNRRMYSSKDFLLESTGDRIQEKREKVPSVVNREGTGRCKMRPFSSFSPSSGNASSSVVGELA
jgi:hypothetical protein